jgi:hypothetical protein
VGRKACLRLLAKTNNETRNLQHSRPAKSEFAASHFAPKTWQNYLKFHRVKKTEINFKMGFNIFFMLLKAAKNGLGIALIELSRKSTFSLNFSQFLIF